MTGSTVTEYLSVELINKVADRDHCDVFYQPQNGESFQLLVEARLLAAVMQVHTLAGMLVTTSSKVFYLQLLALAFCTWAWSLKAWFSTLAPAYEKMILEATSSATQLVF